MRESFEKYLQEQNTLAKKALEAEASKAEGVFELEADNSPNLEKNTEEQFGEEETQVEIFSIQKEKQKVMIWLKEKFADLDTREKDEKYLIETAEKEIKPANLENGEIIEKEEKLRFDFDIAEIEGLEDKREIESFDEEKQVFFYKDKRGKIQEATLGEIITDLEWDIGYNLDKTDKIPRAWKKQYLVERAKKILLKLADEQIIKSERENSEVDDIVKDTYENIQYGREIGADKRKEGFVSEKMVRSFLRQLAFDRDLPIKVQEADVFQDVMEKIDFIIERQTDRLGVRVTETDFSVEEEPEGKSSVAVQFSINPKAEEHKKKQLQRLQKQKRLSGEEVQNMALVIFSKLMAGDLKKEWDRAGRPAGGPVKFMKEEVKKELFEKILQTLFTKEELEVEWGKVTEKE